MTPPPPPQQHHGPFVNSDKGPGLLRRLLGGGTNDPSSPHDHQSDASTSTMHDAPAMPTRQATPTAGGGTRTPLLFRIIGWMFRTFGIRLVIAAVAALLVLIGSIGDQRDNLDRINGGLRELNETFEAREVVDAARAPTAPPGGEPVGQVLVTVEKIELDRLTLREPNGRVHRWVIDDPELFGDVILLNNQRVRARWRMVDGETTFTGFTRVDPPARVPTAPA